MIIPITFEFEEHQYVGSFKTVSGGGSNSLLFLMIDNFFYGQLLYTQYGWQFASNKNHFQNMADFFGCFVCAWLDSSIMPADGDKEIPLGYPMPNSEHFRLPQSHVFAWLS